MKKNVINFILLALLLVLLIYPYISNSVKEGLTNKDYIVLLGDSIFKNDIYVEKGESVGELLRENHKRTLIAARDGAVVDNIYNQYERIPEKINKPSTKILISVGGNDILNNYRFHTVNDYSILNEIFKRYKSAIKKIKSKTKCTIILLNIYYPKSKNYKRFYPLIDRWNNKLKIFSQDNNLKLLTIDNLFKNKKDFTHDIEPSEIGGKKLVNEILNL